MKMQELPVPPDSAYDNPCHFLEDGWCFRAKDSAQPAQRIDLPQFIEQDLQSYLERIPQDPENSELVKDFCDFLWNRFVPSMSFYQGKYRRRLVALTRDSEAMALSRRQSMEAMGDLSSSPSSRVHSFDDNYRFYWKSFFEKFVVPALEKQNH